MAVQTAGGVFPRPTHVHTLPLNPNLKSNLPGLLMATCFGRPNYLEARPFDERTADPATCLTVHLTSEALTQTHV